MKCLEFVSLSSEHLEIIDLHLRAANTNKQTNKQPHTSNTQSNCCELNYALTQFSNITNINLPRSFVHYLNSCIISPFPMANRQTIRHVNLNLCSLNFELPIRVNLCVVHTVHTHHTILCGVCVCVFCICVYTVFLSICLWNIVCVCSLRVSNT